MNKKNFIVFFTLLNLIIFQVDAQIDRDFERARDRYYFGGNFGLSFGTITNVEISPIFGYYITKRWAVGTGVTYQYYKRNDFIKFKTHIYGGRLFSTLYLFPDLGMYFPVGPGLSLFAHGEYVSLSLEESLFLSGPVYQNSTSRFMSNNYLFGGGVMRKGNGRAGMYIMVLFLLNDPVYTTLSNPEIRIGFIF